MCENICITACKMWALWPLYSVHNNYCTQGRQKLLPSASADGLTGF